MNLSWLLLVLGLGHTEASCCMFNRIQEVVQHEPIPAIHMEKQREWAHKLGRTESWGISKVGSISQVDGVSDMAPAYWLCRGKV